MPPAESKNSSPATVYAIPGQAIGDQITKTESETQLDDLVDDELLQVLVRVPQKTARIIRAVARRWNSIICSPYYAARLCSNHPRSDDNTLFLYLEYLNNLIVPSAADPASFHEFPIDLNYLANGCDYHQISSTSEDLLLLSFSYGKYLFVCNPFTKESLRLPPLPLNSPLYISIVCEPNQTHRYRVVNYIVLESGLYLRNVFVSETGRWNNINSPVIWKIRYDAHNPVAYGGKLYWFNEKDTVSYDPFQDIITVIGAPQLDHICFATYWLGVLNGSLTLSMLCYECGPITLYYLIIWELDCELGQWTLKNKSWFQQPNRPDTQDIEIGGLHPTKDIVYFKMSGGIGMHDLSKGSDNFSKVLLPGNTFYDFFMKSFLLTRPWRPTPVIVNSAI